jgi:Ca2+-binding RTX toxin-like protein
MSTADSYEQFMLELVNKERAKAGVQPLAFDGDLNEAADLHTDWMIAYDKFSHTGSGGTSAYTRMKNAGYDFGGSSNWGENIAWLSTRSPTGYQDEVLQLHTNLMNSSGHRANLLKSSFREIGIGIDVGSYQSWNASMVTQDFATASGNPFLLGVAFDDKDGDRSYDVGEGLGGLTVKAVGSGGSVYTATTTASGGYDLRLAAGTYTVTFSGAGYAAKTSTVTIGTANKKLDWIDPATGGTTTTTPDPATKSGTSYADTLVGGSGDQTLIGLAGDDTLDGGIGADTMKGGTGDDVFRVGSSGDVVVELAGEGDDHVFSTVSHTLGSNVEQLTLDGAAAINGTGNALANTIVGNAAANVLKGMAGDDRLEGGAGDDTLYGGTGKDILAGGRHNGHDSFVWTSAAEAGKGAARDVVLDFARGYDEIDLSGIDARSGTTSTNEAFSFIGKSAFSGVSGQLRYQQFDTTGTDYTLVQGDVNGDRIADFEIQVNGLLPFTSADFVL